MADEYDAGKISLRLLVDKTEKRVIFGEAGKDFVDFLFNFLSLPVATVVKLVSKDKMVGSLGKIYESMEAMHVDYMEAWKLLNPKVSSGSKVLYRCSNQYGCSHSYVSTNPQAVCPSCNSCMNSALTLFT